MSNINLPPEPIAKFQCTLCSLYYSTFEEAGECFIRHNKKRVDVQPVAVCPRCGSVYEGSCVAYQGLQTTAYREASLCCYNEGKDLAQEYIDNHVFEEPPDQETYAANCSFCNRIVESDQPFDSDLTVWCGICPVDWEAEGEQNQ